MKFAPSCGCARARSGRRQPALPILLLPLLLPLLPRAAAVPLPGAADSSGEAEPEEAAARRAALPHSLRLAQLLRDRAAQLQREMCEKFTVCENSMEMLLRNNLNLPRVTEEDGCLHAGFDEDKCLKKISSGLYTFQTYLKYVQETFISENQNLESLCYSTEHLAHTIRQMVINPEEVIIPDAATQESLRTKLKSSKTWIEKITTHLILRDFTSFMEKTVRAVRYLKNTRSFSA
ncbi:PREDICTED: interleukin-6 [Lepidothrix coronata]|uniref:Interleukin-6 n=1 Tax=Lepidothrix coronata TaxID=321398 RepID=A0A6J0HZN4_9PASS|nr:PREDICTED: interleukin-6 [Lepidothrix coronata]